jgi:hypothetical protein
LLFGSTVAASSSPQESKDEVSSNPLELEKELSLTFGKKQLG